jgi:hypothetical protein
LASLDLDDVGVFNEDRPSSQLFSDAISGLLRAFRISHRCSALREPHLAEDGGRIAKLRDDAQRKRNRNAWTKWRRLISEQMRSGTSVAAFCREQKLCGSHFYWWKETAAGKHCGEIRGSASGGVPGQRSGTRGSKSGCRTAGACWSGEDLIRNMCGDCWRCWGGGGSRVIGPPSLQAIDRAQGRGSGWPAKPRTCAVDFRCPHHVPHRHRPRKDYSGGKFA